MILLPRLPSLAVRGKLHPFPVALREIKQLLLVNEAGIIACIVQKRTPEDRQAAEALPGMARLSHAQVLAGERVEVYIAAADPRQRARTLTFQLFRCGIAETERL